MSDTGTTKGPQRAHALGAEQLEAYVALIEVGDLLQQAVTRQLRADGDLSHVQFQILAHLVSSVDGSMRMTGLADEIVYSRSGLTYQASLLEKAGLVVRSQSPDDDRGVLVSVTDAGRDAFAQVIPGHVELVRERLFDVLSDREVVALSEILARVREPLRAATFRPSRRGRPARTIAAEQSPS